MVRDSASAEDCPPLQTVLNALDDADCRVILRETAEPMTANELIDILDIPKSTLYRKLELVSRASLVRELDVINPGGGRTTRYERDFDDVMISMNHENELSVRIKRPPRKADERLADIWSKMGGPTMTLAGTVIVIVKTMILVLGTGITYIAFKAYRRTGAPSLRVLGIGFGVITFGALLAGIAHQALSVPLEIGILINSVLVAIGLVIIMYSLYLERG